MKFKGGLILKFLAPTLIVFLVVGFVLSMEARRIIQDEMMERAEVFIVDFVQLQAKQHVHESSSFSLDDPAKTEQIFSALENDIRTREMLRIKAWDKKGTVIYSDAKEIVGKNFSDNKNFQQAISGKIAIEMKKPVDPENIAELGYKQLMEVYVPIFFENKSEPAGVVEAYYKMDLLNQNIRRAQITLLRVIAVAFLVMIAQFTILFWFIILKPLKRLEAGIIGLKERERESKG